MNSDRLHSHLRSRAFTLIELLVVIGIIGILAALLLPALRRGKMQAQRISCGNQLQQIGLGFHAFAHEHNGKFPMQVSPEDGGTMLPSARQTEPMELFAIAAGHFQALSNELVTPKILVCPADLRLPAENFTRLNDAHLSYFAAVTADYSRPSSWLAGDRNLSTTNLTTAGSVCWTEEMHQRKGNVLFADGHVERLNHATFTLAANENGAQNVVLPDSNQPHQTTGLFPQPKPESHHESDSPARNSTSRSSGSAAQNPSRANPMNWVSLPMARFPVAGAVLHELEVRSNATRLATSLSTNRSPANLDKDEAGASDLSALQFSRKAITSSLLLLLLLLLLAYFIWREWRKWQKRRTQQPVRVKMHEDEPIEIKTRIHTD